MNWENVEVQYFLSLTYLVVVSSLSSLSKVSQGKTRLNTKCYALWDCATCSCTLSKLVFPDLVKYTLHILIAHSSHQHLSIDGNVDRNARLGQVLLSGLLLLLSSRFE